MTFIEIEEDKIINFNNVTAIRRINEKLIRIYFIDEYMDFRRENEEEINDLWKELKKAVQNERIK